MDLAERRRATTCLSPVVVDPVIEDPQLIRELARENGPYFQPGRQRVPPGLVWPSWRAEWAAHDKPLLAAAEPLLVHAGFISAAAEMCGSDRVVPVSLCVNLATPSRGQPVSHTDMPEFEGVDRTNAEGWLLQAMGASGLFEPERISVITAVAWFFEGERGFFRYWPRGRDQASVRHEAIWNTAVVGDNDLMHHKVERIGPAGMKPPPEMTIDTLLDHDGDGWVVVEADRVVARYSDEHVRLSLAWKARVVEEDTPVAPITLDDVFDRFAEAVGEDFAACSVDELMSVVARDQLVARWPGFRPD